MVKWLSPAEQDAWCQSITDAVEQLCAMPGPEQLNSLQRNSQAFFRLQQLRLFGAYHWHGWQALDSCSPDSAEAVVAKPPKRSLRLSRHETRPEVCIFVDAEGVHLIPIQANSGLGRHGSGETHRGSSRGRLWSFMFCEEGHSMDRERLSGVQHVPDNSDNGGNNRFSSAVRHKRSSGATVRSDASDCFSGRLLRWGATPVSGLLQLVVWLADPEKPREGPSELLVSLACPQAMDAASAMHEVLSDIFWHSQLG